MSDKKVSDPELVVRCKAELPYHTISFELLMNRYKEKVFRKVLAMLRNREEAEDVTQDVFIKVFHALPSFRSDSTFSTWLYTITVNTCLNHIEKMERRPWWWLAEGIDEGRKTREQEKELFYLIGRSIEQNHLQQMIELTLDKLNEQSQEILELRFFEELDYRTISERLRIGLSATKMRLKRAREEFKQQFEKLSEEIRND